MRLIGYLRVSTGDQSVDSAGQRHAIEQWSAREAHEVVEWCADDGVSGAKGLDQRPALSAAIDKCIDTKRRRRRFEGIVAFDASRFSRDRNLSGLLRWTARKHRFDLLSTDGRLDTRKHDDFASVATELLGDLLSEQARVAIRHATRAALANRRDNGFVAGHLPYGFSRDGMRLVPDASEQAVVSRVLELRAAGESFQTIATILNVEGRRTRRGGEWTRISVFKLAQSRAASLKTAP